MDGGFGKGLAGFVDLNPQFAGFPECKNIDWLVGSW
jgi:hypothetical protein